VYVAFLWFAVQFSLKHISNLHFAVKKIASGNFQENLEFLQWCLQHMQRINPKAREQYLAFDRRDEAQEQRARRIATASGMSEFMILNLNWTMINSILICSCGWHAA
jgi:hypothetical protein